MTDNKDSFNKKQNLKFEKLLITFQKQLKMQSGDYKVADISLADFGRKEIELAEIEVSKKIDHEFECKNENR